MLYMGFNSRIFQLTMRWGRSSAGTLGIVLLSVNELGRMITALFPNVHGLPLATSGFLSVPPLQLFWWFSSHGV
jgi:hypothetical protein